MIAFPEDIKQAETGRYAALKAAVSRAESELKGKTLTPGERRRKLDRWRAARAELDQIAATGYVWSPGEGYPAETAYVNPEQ